jgi:hypothetical protein
MWGSGPLYLPMPPTKMALKKRQAFAKTEPEPEPESPPRRNIRDKEHARLKRMHADECVMLYTGFMVLITVMVAAVFGAEMVIQRLQTLPPPPPPPPPKNVAEAFVEALWQYFRCARS